MGLEKTKARAGETSSSARALTIEDMYHLYDQCFPPSASSPSTLRQGTVRYVSGSTCGHLTCQLLQPNPTSALFLGCLSLCMALDASH